MSKQINQISTKNSNEQKIVPNAMQIYKNQKIRQSNYLDILDSSDILEQCNLKIVNPSTNYQVKSEAT